MHRGVCVCVGGGVVVKTKIPHSREVCGHLGGRQFACEAAADRPDGVGVATAGPNQVLPGPRECSPRKIRTESKD